MPRFYCTICGETLIDMNHSCGKHKSRMKSEVASGLGWGKPGFSTKEYNE